MAGKFEISALYHGTAVCSQLLDWCGPHFQRSSGFRSLCNVSNIPSGAASEV